MSTFSKQWDSSSAFSDIQSHRALIVAIIPPFTSTPTCPYGMKNDGKFGFIAVQDRLLTKRWNTSPTAIERTPPFFSRISVKGTPASKGASA